MECLYQLKLNQANPQSGSQTSAHHHIVKTGFYLRQSDRMLIQRYRCFSCQRHFSTETLHPCRYQKKRGLNAQVFEYLVSGVSQRRAAKLLKVNQKTIVRKFVFLGQHCAEKLQTQRHLAKYLANKKVSTLQFDDLETFEHTKCKPLSITLAIEEKTRFILGFRVAQMPAKGHLAKKALKKYGPRADHRKAARKDLFQSLQKYLHHNATIKSDMNPHYLPDVRTYFKTQQYIAYKGRRGCVVGQGELKAGGFDPLFSLNHTAAMIRANLNRMFRRTWCTTKKSQRLELHLALYTFYHNLVLIKTSSP